jgi:hypothetical protein
VTGQQRGPSPSARWLAWGDAASLVAFTIVGLQFHRMPVSLPAVLQTAVPLLAAWFAVARLLRTYDRPGLWPFLLTWLVAVPVGLALRHVWLGRPFGPGFLHFVAVAGAFTLVFLGVWRIAALAVRAVRARIAR